MKLVIDWFGNLNWTYYDSASWLIAYNLTGYWFFKWSLRFLQIRLDHPEYRSIIVPHPARTGGSRHQSSIWSHTTLDRFQIHIGNLSALHFQCNLNGLTVSHRVDDSGFKSMWVNEYSLSKIDVAFGKQLPYDCMTGGTKCHMTVFDAQILFCVAHTQFMPHTIY